MYLIRFGQCGAPSLIECEFLARYRVCCVSGISFWRSPGCLSMHCCANVSLLICVLDCQKKREPGLQVAKEAVTHKRATHSGMMIANYLRRHNQLQRPWCYSGLISVHFIGRTFTRWSIVSFCMTEETR